MNVELKFQVEKGKKKNIRDPIILSESESKKFRLKLKSCFY